MTEWLELGDPRHPGAEAGSRFVAYEEIADARQVGRFPVAYEFTLHGGQRMTVRWGAETEEVGDGMDLLTRVIAMATHD